MRRKEVGAMAKRYRVLSLDGGGMRGIYTAAYLHGMINTYSARRKVDYLDLGKGFDLIVGTSTGAMIACALAKGVRMNEVVKLYHSYGPRIFEQRIYDGPKAFFNFFGRPARLKRGAEALEEGLTGIFGQMTLGELYTERGIALSIPAVDMGRHRALVFKTSHVGGDRDDKVRVVDACLASSAAPIFRSFAALTPPDGLETSRVFADGGLWANNPVLVGLLDALRATEVDTELEIFAMGTCPRPEGEQISGTGLYRSLYDWRFGGKAAQLSIAAQESAFDHMGRLLANELRRHGRTVDVWRFPSGRVAASTMHHLDLDNASKEARDALVAQAQIDVDETKSRCDDPNSVEGRAIKALFEALTPV
jgi:predicted acylesterase/phospholipase RssA